MGFSDTIDVQLPQALDDGAYGLSLAVRRSGGPMVDLVPIQVGQTDELRRPTTQRDMDASLEACPPVAATRPQAEPLLELAVSRLAARLGTTVPQIEVHSVEAVDFPDTGLGVPEPGRSYAQVITPGYVIELAVEGQVYTYHAAGDRVVFVPRD